MGIINYPGNIMKKVWGRKNGDTGERDNKCLIAFMLASEQTHNQ